MEIKLNIRIDAPSGGVRRLTLFGVVPILGVAAMAAIASATLSPDPSTWAISKHPVPASSLAANLTQLDQRLSAVEAEPACPRGYTQGATPSAPTFTNQTVTVCTNPTSGDQVVKVGTGASAFWMDRYEATVWTAPSGGAMTADNSDTAFTAAVPSNGQTVTPLYALSLPSKTPSRTMTWFQAVEFCAASGKRLPGRQEWFRAARGTPDPGNNDGTTNQACNTANFGIRSTASALGSTRSGSCVSDWGVEDMVGNLSEWTDEWYAAPYTTVTNVNTAEPWPNPANGSYNGDATWNVASGAYTDTSGTFFVGVPSASQRGGAWGTGTGGGIFAQNLSNAAMNWWDSNGFRCMVPSGS